VKRKKKREKGLAGSKMMNSSLPDTNKPAWLNDDASLEAPTTPLKATNAAALSSSSSNYGSGNVTKTAGIMTLVLQYNYFYINTSIGYLLSFVYQIN
jgi:hypothetical protein